MKIYIYDFWYVFIIKVTRRIQANPKTSARILRQKYIDKDGALENSAKLFFLGAFILTFLAPLLSLFFTRRESKTIALPLIILMLLFIYFRYEKNKKWKLIEQEIDFRYTRRKRDLIFSFIVVFFWSFLTLFKITVELF